MKKFLSVLLAAMMIVCSFSLVSAKTDEEPTRAGVGMSVLGYNRHDLNGNTHTSDEIADYDLTFINYWSTGCGPCVQEMPHIRQMYNYFLGTEENDVNVLGALSYAYNCTPSGAKSFCESNGYNWPTLDKVAGDPLEQVFSTSGYIPQTLIVDRNGMVRDHIVGSFSSYNELMNCVNMWLDVFQNHSEETVTVSYLCDATNEVIHTEEIPYGGLIPALNAEDLPEVEGYLFSSLIYNDPNIYETAYQPSVYLAMGDCTVTCHYNIRKYLVRFYDSFNGHIISSQQVNHGSAATPPAAPDHEDEGCFFLGWDRDFSCITEQTFIYSVISYRGDVDGDGNITIMDSLMIMRQAMGLISGLNEEYADFDGDGSITVSDALSCMRTAMGI